MRASAEGQGNLPLLLWQLPSLYLYFVPSCGLVRSAYAEPSTLKTSASKPDSRPLSRSEARAVQALAWPDVWARRLRMIVDAHAFDTRGREYELGILRDESSYIIVPKGAQLGLTTTFLVKGMHAVVVRAWQLLYLLPVKAGSVGFVQARIDPIIESAPALKSEFNRVDNRAQKQTNRGTNWYIRGTNIETELREVPADILVLDERDKMNEDNMPHAFERLSGSKVQRVYELSTPTVDGFGVFRDNGFLASDQMRWWVPCPHCGSYQVITFEENVLQWLGDTIEECADACRCSHCHKPLSDEDRAEMNSGGQWVPDNPGAPVRGYHLNQFNSPTKRLSDPQLGILVNWFDGQKDAKKLKEFYNLALGLPYAAPGEKFTVELLDKIRGDYEIGVMPESSLFIGIDQGTNILHVTLWTRDLHKRLKLWDARLVTGDGIRTKWQVLDEDLLARIPQWLAVCDAHPDKEDAESLSKRYPGRFWMGFEKDRPDQPMTAAFLDFKYGEPAKVNIDRTMAFDSYIKQALDGLLMLPRSARDLGEFMPKLGYNGFYSQHLQLVRVEQPDTQGRMVARWVNGNAESAKKGTGKRPDHWHHSGIFGLIASMKEVPLQVPAEIGELFKRAGGLVAA